MSGQHCRHCGRPIDPYRRQDAAFCDDTCKQRAYRRRQQGVREGAEPLSLGLNACGVTLADWYGGASEKQENVTALERR